MSAPRLPERRERVFRFHGQQDYVRRPHLESRVHAATGDRWSEGTWREAMSARPVRRSCKAEKHSKAANRSERAPFRRERECRACLYRIPRIDTREECTPSKPTSDQAD